MTRKTKIGLVTGIAMLIGSAAAATVDASRETVDVILSHEVITAGAPQTVYLKVGLSVDGESGFRAPVNVAIVIDRSGSMQGEKLVRAKEAAALAVNRLRPDDIVSIIAYDDSVQILLPATKVTDRAAVLAAIERLQPGGSTALFAGVSVGAAEVRKFLDRERVNRVVLLSDGLANVGPDSPAELGALGASLKKEGVAVSTIGLGLGYNEDLMARLAGSSDGNHAFVEHPRDLARIFDQEFGDAMSVTAQDVVVRIECEPSVRPVRVLGREAEIAGRMVTVSLNQLYDDEERMILLELEVPSGEAGRERQVAWVRWSYRLMSGGTGSGTKVVTAAYSSDERIAAASRNDGVMVAVVEQIANEKNRLAVQLRDQGRIKDAQDLLLQNTAYVRGMAFELKSPALERVADESEADAEMIVQEQDWTMQRKAMTESQVKRSQQRKQ